jgi:hypothetical protein
LTEADACICQGDAGILELAVVLIGIAIETAHRLVDTRAVLPLGFA